MQSPAAYSPGTVVSISSLTRIFPFHSVPLRSGGPSPSFRLYQVLQRLPLPAQKNLLRYLLPAWTHHFLRRMPETRSSPSIAWIFMVLTGSGFSLEKFRFLSICKDRHTGSGMGKILLLHEEQNHCFQALPLLFLCEKKCVTYCAVTDTFSLKIPLLPESWQKLSCFRLPGSRCVPQNLLR